eukprot:scaffold66303_cov50-Cyclotella_meneghiniana.AAC.2
MPDHRSRSPIRPITSALIVIVALLHHNVHPLPFLSSSASPSCSHLASNSVTLIRSRDNT